MLRYKSLFCSLYPLWLAISVHAAAHLDYAQELYHSKDHYRSSVEVDRLLALQPEAPDSAHFLSALNDYHLGRQNQLAKKLADTPHPKRKVFFSRLLTLHHLSGGDLAQAKVYAATSGEEYRQFLEEHTAVEAGYLDSDRAELYSSILPGSGLLLTGEYGKAATSFALNSIFLYGIAKSLEEKKYGMAVFLLFFEVGWYKGGINATAESVAAYNHTLQRGFALPWIAEQLEALEQEAGIPQR